MPTVQQQAKSLAAKKLSSDKFNYDSEAGNYTTQNQNAANSRYDQLYDRQLQDARVTQGMSLWNNVNQRQSDVTRGSIAAGGQVGASQASAAASVMEQTRLNQQFEVEKNASMGLDARGNVKAIPIGDYNGDGIGGDSKSGGSFSESFGLGAAAPSGYHYSPYGVKSLYNASEVADWRMRQQGVLDDQYGQEKRSSDLDRDKQSFLTQQKASLDAAAFQRQTIADSQRAGQDRAYQSQQSEKDRANQRALAQIDSRTRLQQSIFNGNGNGYQYWGGSI